SLRRRRDRPRIPRRARLVWEGDEGAGVLTSCNASMRLLQIDAFTDRPFRGNPAAVCFLDRERDDEWMANVAKEMNLAETAFLLPTDDGYSLRWFTPAVEVDLCGHATLASAHALWEEKLLAPDATARFHSRSGLLTASHDGEWIELDFPAKPDEKSDAPPGLLESLGGALRVKLAGNRVKLGGRAVTVLRGELVA